MVSRLGGATKTMRATEFITEALKPSEYRQFVKNWDSSRYEDIFRSDD